MAAQDGEARVDEALRCLLEQGEVGEGKLNKDAVRAWLELTDESRRPPVTQVAVTEVSLDIFDELLGGETAARQ